jgi:hypothetical protein
MIIVLLTTGFPEDSSSRGRAFKQIVTKSQNAGAGCDERPPVASVAVQNINFASCALNPG